MAVCRKSLPWFANNVYEHKGKEEKKKNKIRERERAVRQQQRPEAEAEIGNDDRAGGKVASGRHWNRRKTVTKEGGKKFILQSKPTKSYQLINSPWRQGRREREEHLGTQAPMQKPANLQLKGPWEEGAVHSAELYTVMSCIMTFQSKGDHIYNIGPICL